AYLIAEGDELVLVDTGIPGRTRSLLQLLAKLRRQAADVKHILITHHHYDHTGNLAQLAERCGATIHVHPLDAPITKGDAHVPGSVRRSACSRRTTLRCAGASRNSPASRSTRPCSATARRSGPARRRSSRSSPTA